MFSCSLLTITLPLLLTNADLNSLIWSLTSLRANSSTVSGVDLRSIAIRFSSRSLIPALLIPFFGDQYSRRISRTCCCFFADNSLILQVIIKFDLMFSRIAIFCWFICNFLDSSTCSRLEFKTSLKLLISLFVDVCELFVDFVFYLLSKFDKTHFYIYFQMFYKN